ncbi:conjugative transfer protein GumN [Neiella marina]|uniref:Conjugative transfer protein GumN n=1 Tax=Neiella marina TaxID=508461 RepID=A0A8J2U2L9_9GAMM|nr:TraB/GumN family protein [Neiella marina]GGA66749.1 conjugative transfer protein GumN [Neiella marina]
MLVNSAIRKLYNSFAVLLCLTASYLAHAGNGASPALYLAQKGDTKIYLLGSIHAGREDFYPLASHIQQAFQDADELLLELTPDQMTPQQLQAAMMKFGVLSSPKPLQDRMTSATYDQIKTVIADAGLPAHQLIFMRDWAILIQLTVATIQKMGLAADQGVDQHFSTLAASAGKPMRGLETLEQQFEILASMDELGPELLYKDFVNELSYAKNWLQAVESAWRNGDAARLNSLYQEYDERQQQADFMSKLNRDRNKNWRDQLVLLPTGKTYMMVVGDMHIHANDSVLDFLKESDFEVKQIHHVVAAQQTAAL